MDDNSTILLRPDHVTRLMNENVRIDCPVCRTSFVTTAGSAECPVCEFAFVQTDGGRGGGSGL